MRLFPLLLLACCATSVHAQSWTNVAVDQESLKSLPPLAAPTLPPPPPPPAKRAVLIAGGLSDQDFPQAAINFGEGGLVVARFTVDARGDVIDCTTPSKTALPNLSAATCAIIKARFKFKPAQDANGKAVSEVRTQRITWRPPYQITPAYPIVMVGEGQGLRVPLQVMVDAKGRVGQCRITNVDHAAIAYQADICATMAAALTFPIKNDPAGKPAPYATDHVLWVAGTIQLDGATPEG